MSSAQRFSWHSTPAHLTEPLSALVASDGAAVKESSTGNLADLYGVLKEV